MKLKRKRAHDSESPRSAKTPRQPLTEANLSRLNTLTSSLYSTATKMEDTSRGSSTLLERHRIYADRDCTKPAEIEALVAAIRKTRPGNPTPKSKKIAKKWYFTNSMNEDDAMRMLENLLGYLGEIEDDEDAAAKGIHRTFNRNFILDTVPLATAPSARLQALLKELALPSRPQPDISYGYSGTALGEYARVALDRMPWNCLATRQEPWLPFWLVEWKGVGGRMEDARTQARRDGAAAVNAMHNFYQILNQPATAADTAVFSACIGPDTIVLRCHWRNDTDPDKISWEAERVGQGFLNDEDHMFQLRSMILNIRDWALGKRLARVKDALSNGHDRVAKLKPNPRTRSPVKAGTSTTSESDQTVTVRGQQQLTPSESSGDQSRSGKKRKVDGS